MGRGVVRTKSNAQSFGDSCHHILMGTSKEGMIPPFIFYRNNQFIIYLQTYTIDVDFCCYVCVHQFFVSEQDGLGVVVIFRYLAIGI